MKRTNTSTPVFVVLMASLVCLLGVPRDARSGQGTKAIMQTAGIGAVMSAACIATAALVAESDTVEDGYARRGWLVGAGGSYAMETFEDDVESEFQSVLGSTVSFSADDSFGVNGRVGYRCHQRFSVEVEVEWLDGSEADISDTTLVKAFPVDVEPWVYTVNTKGYLLTGRYQPFLLLGVGVMTASSELGFTQGVVADVQYCVLSDLCLYESVDKIEFAMRFGAGIDLYATKHVVVSAEVDYVFPFGDLENFNYVSFGLGLQYRF